MKEEPDVRPESPSGDAKSAAGEAVGSDLTRSRLARIALAAWCNIDPESLPAEKMWIEHPNNESRMGWDRVVEAVAAATSAEWRDTACRLWMLLDDIDTASDAAKADDAIFREFAERHHQRRFDLLSGEEVDCWHGETAERHPAAPFSPGMPNKTAHP